MSTKVQIDKPFTTGIIFGFGLLVAQVVLALVLFLLVSSCGMMGILGALA